MAKQQTFGAEEARARLPEILESAHHGTSTIVTKRGRPYAVVVPVGNAARGGSFLALKGTGKGLWGEDPASVTSRLREEWP